MRLAGHTIQTGRLKCVTNFSSKYDGRRPFGRAKSIVEGNIKKVLKETV
jgi:hypothetical protein